MWGCVSGEYPSCHLVSSDHAGRTIWRFWAIESLSWQNSKDESAIVESVKVQSRNSAKRKRSADAFRFVKRTDLNFTSFQPVLVIVDCSKSHFVRRLWNQLQRSMTTPKNEFLNQRDFFVSQSEKHDAVKSFWYMNQRPTTEVIESHELPERFVSWIRRKSTTESEILRPRKLDFLMRIRAIKLSWIVTSGATALVNSQSIRMALLKFARCSWVSPKLQLWSFVSETNCARERFEKAKRVSSTKVLEKLKKNILNEF